MQSTRRTFLKMAGSAAATIVAFNVTGVVRGSEELVRPPGAVAETDFQNLCLRCHQCIKVCPEKALSSAHITDGWNNTATPALIGGCTLCMKCTQTCPSGALAKVSPQEAKMGTAMVIEKECVGCERCIKSCPAGAISKVPGKRLVQIDQERCTGCGKCVKVCPAKPVALKITASGAKRPAFAARS